MNHDEPDFGSGQKKLSIYLIGMVACIALTLIAFWSATAGGISRFDSFIIIYSAACIQFFVQLLCFLRLNVQTEQSRFNVLSIIFTGVILVTIIVGSLWIMANLNYYMMH